MGERRATDPKTANTRSIENVEFQGGVEITELSSAGNHPWQNPGKEEATKLGEFQSFIQLTAHMRNL